MNIEKLTFLMHAAAGYSVVNFRYKRMKRIEVASEAKPKLFCPYSLYCVNIFPRGLIRTAKSYPSTHTQCLKITEKVSFNIASEASYIYILSRQKFIKRAKNGQFWRVFENLKLLVKQCYQTGQF